MRHSAIPLLAAAIALLAAAPAHAAFQSDLTNGNITMTGDGNGDFVRIERSGPLLIHNRNSDGDPSFASDSDWDTGTAGSQQLNASSLANVFVNAGGGTDVISLGGDGDPASVLVPDFSINGGGSVDAILIDSADDAAGRTATFSSNIGVGTVAITGNSATLNLSHEDVDGVLMRFGDGSDTATIGNTDAGAPIVLEGSGGNDTANINATGLLGGVEFNGGTGTTDTANFNGGSSAGTYLIGTESISRAGFHRLAPKNDVERVNLNAGGQNDSIFKTSPRAVTINAGGGDDLISARDAVGDTANCGAGNDFILTDALDALNECESSDRTLSQPPANDGGGTGGGTDMTGTMNTMTTMNTMMAGEMADKTAPAAGISGVKGSIKLKTFLKGLKGKVIADEASSYEVQLLGSTSSARLARTYNLVLARQNLKLDNAIRDIKLKPSKRLIGRARKFSVRIVVTPTDAAGNRGKAVTKTVKVKR